MEVWTLLGLDDFTTAAKDLHLWSLHLLRYAVDFLQPLLAVRPFVRAFGTNRWGTDLSGNCWDLVIFLPGLLSLLPFESLLVISVSFSPFASGRCLTVWELLHVVHSNPDLRGAPAVKVCLVSCLNQILPCCLWGKGRSVKSGASAESVQRSQRKKASSSLQYFSANAWCFEHFLVQYTDAIFMHHFIHSRNHYLAQPYIGVSNHWILSCSLSRLIGVDFFENVSSCQGQGEGLLFSNSLQWQQQPV